MSRGVKKGVKPSVKDFAVDRYRCQASVKVQKHQTQEMRLDQSTRCRKAIEGPGTFSFDPPAFEDLSRLRYEKTLRARQIARCRGGIEEVLRLIKNRFSRREKHR